MKIFCLTPILVILLLHGVSAQRHARKQIAIISPWEIGFSGGVASFVTSINPDGEVTGKKINYWNRDFNPGIGLFVVRNFSPALGVELNWLNTRLTGSWNNSYAPLVTSTGADIPLPFRSKINQLDLMIAFNVNQILLPGDEEDSWHLYIKTGIGLTNIKNTDKFEWRFDYVNTRMSLAFDAGVSVSLTENVKLLLGNTIRSVNTDNLDGVFVVSADTNGKPVYYTKVFEIYNYTYLRLSYSLNDFGLKKSKSTFRHRKK